MLKDNIKTTTVRLQHNRDKSIFFRFLKDNFCYRKFINNFISESGIRFRHYNSIPLNVKLYFDYTSKYEYVTSAFNWDNTKEGMEYWCRIFNKWKVICYNEK